MASTQSVPVYNYPGVVSERDPRSSLVESVRRMMHELENHKQHIHSLEEDLKDKRERVADLEHDIASTTLALDRLSTIDLET